MNVPNFRVGWTQLSIPLGLKLAEMSVKSSEIFFLQSGSSFGPSAIELYTEFITGQQRTADCTYHGIPREPVCKRKKMTTIFVSSP